MGGAHEVRLQYAVLVDGIQLGTSQSFLALQPISVSMSTGCLRLIANVASVTANIVFPGACVHHHAWVHVCTHICANVCTHMCAHARAGEAEAPDVQTVVLKYRAVDGDGQPVRGIYAWISGRTSHVTVMSHVMADQMSSP